MRLKSELCPSFLLLLRCQSLVFILVGQQQHEMEKTEQAVAGPHPFGLFTFYEFDPPIWCLESELEDGETRLHCSQLGKVSLGLLGACWSLWEVSHCSLSSFSSFLLLLVINEDDCKHLKFHIAQFLDLKMDT